RDCALPCRLLCATHVRRGGASGRACACCASWAQCEAGKLCKMPSTAIVLGATGLVGRTLVQQLTLAPHVDRLVSVTRRPVEYESPQVVNRVVDFDHVDDFASVFDGHWLFSALGTTRKQAGSIDAQRIVDVDYQFNAAQLAAMNGVQHYLLVSSS